MDVYYATAHKNFRRFSSSSRIGGCPLRKDLLLLIIQFIFIYALLKFRILLSFKLRKSSLKFLLPKSAQHQIKISPKHQKREEIPPKSAQHQQRKVPPKSAQHSAVVSA